jgi:hypothetical protein
VVFIYLVSPREDSPKHEANEEGFSQQYKTARTLTGGPQVNACGQQTHRNYDNNKLQK